MPPSARGIYKFPMINAPQRQRYIPVSYNKCPPAPKVYFVYKFLWLGERFRNSESTLQTCISWRRSWHFSFFFPKFFFSVSLQNTSKSCARLDACGGFHTTILTQISLFNKSWCMRTALKIDGGMGKSVLLKVILFEFIYHGMR